MSDWTNAAAGTSGFLGGFVGGLQAIDQMETNKLRRQSLAKQQEYTDWKMQQEQQDVADKKVQDQYAGMANQLALIRRNGTKPEDVATFMQENQDHFSDIVNEGAQDGESKRLVGMGRIPDSDRFYLNVRVDRPDGTSDLKPVTKNRSSDPNDPVVTFTPKQLLDVMEMKIAKNYKGYLDNQSTNLAIQKYQQDSAAKSADLENNTYKSIYEMIKSGNMNGVVKVTNTVNPQADVANFSMDNSGTLYAINSKGEPALNASGAQIKYHIPAMQRGFEQPKKYEWKSIPKEGRLVNTVTGEVIEGQSGTQKPEMTEATARKQIMAIEKSVAQMDKAGKVDPAMMILAKTMNIDIPENGEQLSKEAKQRFMQAANEQIAYYKRFIPGSGGGATSGTMTQQQGSNGTSGNAQQQRPADDILINTFKNDTNIQQRIAAGKPFYIKTQWGNVKFDGTNLTWE